MQFEKKVTIGDVIAVVACITAIAFSMKEIRQTEAQMERELADITDLARDVERAQQELQEQRQEFLEEKLARTVHSAEDLESSNRINSAFLEIGRNSRAFYSKLASSMLLSQFLLHHALLASEDEEYGEILRRSGDLTAAWLHLVAKKQEWDNQLGQISDYYDKERFAAVERLRATNSYNASEIGAMNDSLISELAKEISELNGRSQVQLEPLLQDLNTKAAELMKVLGVEESEVN